jgi:hypothetical protein
MKIRPDQTARAVDNWRKPFEWPDVWDYISLPGQKARNNGVWIEPPNRVSFPICCACRSIIWDDPILGDEQPWNDDDDRICSACFCEPQ